MKIAPARYIALFVLILTAGLHTASAQANLWPATGNVGIGTTAPGDKLTVVGTGVFKNTVGSAAGTNAIRLVPDATPSLYFIRSVVGWGDTWWNWTMGTDNKLRLSFSSVPQLTLQNGAMGIGTDSPTQRLTVSGGNGAVDQWLASFQAGLDASGNRKEIIIGYNGALDYGYIQGHHQNSHFSNVVLQASGGNVGIGTNNPTAKFDVLGDVNAGGSSWSGYYARANGTVATLRVTDSTSYGTAIGFVGTDTNSAFAIRTNAQPVAWFAPNGNVGIGTTNPTQKLSVNGTIRAKEIIVEASPWPDDVFAPGYVLPSVEEVAAHIESNGHLPGVPSAAAVGEEGVALGEMQKTMMRKIEELTLYMIDVKRENARLRAELETLKQSITP